MDFKDKSVVYVGGFGGIGFDSCRSFLENGIAKLIIMDMKPNSEKLSELKCHNIEVQVEFLQLDLTKREEIVEAFNVAGAKLSNIDILVNGGGMMNEQQIEETVAVNLVGPIYCTLAALPYMDKSQGGKGGLIVNISSIVGLDAFSSYAVYTATKYGINGFARALSEPYYYEKTNVGYITICPSTTETPMLAALRVNPVSTFEDRPPLPLALCNHQTAEECGRNVVKAIKTGKNGSFWILKSGTIKEYVYPSIK